MGKNMDCSMKRWDTALDIQNYGTENTGPNLRMRKARPYGLLQKTKALLGLNNIHSYRDANEVGDFHKNKTTDPYVETNSTVNRMWMRRSLLTIEHFHADRTVPAEVKTAVSEGLVEHGHIRKMFRDRMLANACLVIVELNESNDGVEQTLRRARPYTRKQGRLTSLMSKFGRRHNGKIVYDDSGKSGDYAMVDKKNVLTHEGKKRSSFDFP
ncbi:hypothetical protein ScPMuIL_009594 [Solemya velum]